MSWSREDIQLIVTLVALLSGVIPSVALSVLTSERRTASASVIAFLAVLQLALGATDVVLGAQLVREMFKPMYGEGGLLTLLFMAVGAFVCLVGIGLLVAGALQLAGWRAARFVHLTLATILGILVALAALLFLGAVVSRAKRS
jgi:hypothetical protein